VGDEVPALDPASLTRIVSSYRLSQAILAAARLGVADALAAGPLPADAIAARLGVHAPSLARLLRALAGEGVLAEPEPGHYGLNAFSDQLRSDHPAAMRDFIIGWSGLSVGYHAFAELAPAIRSGRNAMEERYGHRFHELLDRDPVSAGEYDRAMAGDDPELLDMMVAAYDWPGVRTVVDVGGGRGPVLASILRRLPEATGVLFDLPRVVDGVEDDLARRPEGARMRVVGGSMFDAVPAGGDAYIFSTVLRCFDDDEVLPALRRCREAMHPGARLVAIEMVYPEGPAVPLRGMADLQAMVVYGGRDRTPGEWRALFGRAGLRLGRIIETGTPYSLVEATPA
jgi:hypothetical protein